MINWQQQTAHRIANTPIVTIAGMNNVSWTALLVSERATRTDMAAFSEALNHVASGLGGKGGSAGAKPTE